MASNDMFNSIHLLFSIEAYEFLSHDFSRSLSLSSFNLSIRFMSISAKLRLVDKAALEVGDG